MGNATEQPRIFEIFSFRIEFPNGNGFRIYPFFLSKSILRSFLYFLLFPAKSISRDAVLPSLAVQWCKVTFTLFIEFLMKTEYWKVILEKAK